MPADLAINPHRQSAPGLRFIIPTENFENPGDDILKDLQKGGPVQQKSDEGNAAEELEKALKGAK